jgi:hypothetical protein
MGYALSRSSVIRNREQLEQLLQMQTTLVFKTANPQRLAYKLREAIAAAQMFEEFSDLASIRHMYKFKARSGEVIALYDYEPSTEGQTIEGKRFERKPPVPEKKVVPGVINLVEILVAAIKMMEESEILFPNAAISEEDKGKMFEWAVENSWKFIDHGEGGLTLTRKKVPEEILWKPQD